MNLKNNIYYDADDASYQKQEQDLIRRCQQGDKKAFHQIIQRYQDQVFTYISQNLSDHTQARAVTRQVFVAAYQAFAHFRGEISLKAWILSLAEQHLLRAQRQQLPWYQRILPQRLFSSTTSQAEIAQDSDLPHTDCDVISDMLSPYLDDELSELDAKRVEKHLHGCSRCQREFDELQDTLNLVQSFGLLNAPPELRVEIMQELDQIRSVRQRLMHWFPTPGIRVAALAASLVMIALGAFIAVQQQQIRLLHNQLQQQKIVRGLEPITPSIADGLNTFVIFTGKLVSRELSLASGEILEQIAPDPKKVQTRFLPGTIDILGEQIEVELQNMHAEIVEDHLIREEGLQIRKILADAPATPGFLFSRFLQRITPPETAPDTPPDFRTIRLEIYLLDQQ